MADALRLERVRAGYGQTVVLEDVDLVLRERGALAVLGRNGVGKTTLLATIMGHTTFHSGEILLAEKSISRLPVYQRSRLGVHPSARRRARAISPRVILVVTASRMRARASRARAGAAAADRLSHLLASTISRGTPCPLS